MILALRNRDIRNQHGTQQVSSSFPGALPAFGAPDAPGLRQWNMVPAGNASQPDARGHYAEPQLTQHGVPAQHGPEVEQRLYHQLVSQQQLYPLANPQLFEHQQNPQTQQPAAHPRYFEHVPAAHPGAGGGAIGTVGVMQAAGSGTGPLWDCGASCMPGPGNAADRFESQESLGTRLREASPSGHDSTWPQDLGGANNDAAQNKWSRDEVFVKAAAYVPRMEPVWSKAVCPVSTDAMKNMRKRAHAIAQGKCLPSEPSTGTRTKATSTVKRSKLAGEAVTSDIRDSQEQGAGVIPASEKDQTESTTTCQGSEIGSNKMPGGSSGCSGVSEPTASASCSGADNGNENGSRGSESYGADSRSNGSESSGADSSGRDSRSNGSESASADSKGSNGSDSNGADTSDRDSRSDSGSSERGRDHRSNLSASTGGDSGSDRHDLASGEGGNSHESSSNDGVLDEGSSSGGRDGSSESGSEGGSEHETSSSEFEGRRP